MITELTEKELYILISKDKELKEYYFKKGHYPKYEEHYFWSVGTNRFDFDAVEDFHIDHAETLELPDACFCGFRANHFALIYGGREQDGGPNCRSVIIFANRKGFLGGTLFKFFMEE